MGSYINWQKQVKDSLEFLYIGKGSFSSRIGGITTSQEDNYFYIRYKDLIKYFSEDFILNTSLENLIEKILSEHPEIFLCGRRKRNLVDDVSLKNKNYEMLEFNKDYVFKYKNLFYTINIVDY